MSSASRIVPAASAQLNALVKTLRVNLSTTRILQFIPKLAKVFVFLVFLANIRSWPFFWHVRIFKDAMLMRLSYRRRMLAGILKTSAQRVKAEDDWWDEYAPIGQSPFTIYTPYKTRAYIDDCDFYGHLSNSSYAKTLDTARFNAALNMFPVFFRAGGWIALGGTHYNFVREIPRLQEYEVYTGIASWDNKWLYVIHKFVSKSSGKKGRPKDKAPAPALTDAAPSPSLRTASSELVSSTDTPTLPVNGNAAALTTPETTPVDATLLDHSLINALPLHTIVISQICFKIGRITVPPTLVLAINGFTSQSPTTSRSNPHAEWKEVKKIMSRPYGGHPRKLKQFLVGGWKDVPLEEKWWEQDGVLGGRIEEQRKKNLEVVDRLRSGLELAREL